MISSDGDRIRPSRAQARRDDHEHTLTAAEHTEMWDSVLAAPSDDPWVGHVAPEVAF